MTEYRNRVQNAEEHSNQIKKQSEELKGLIRQLEDSRAAMTAKLRTNEVFLTETKKQVDDYRGKTSEAEKAIQQTNEQMNCLRQALREVDAEKDNMQVIFLIFC